MMRSGDDDRPRPEDAPARAGDAAGLPERLRARRMAAGLSRRELADAAGVTERTVRDIENGRRARVQEKTLLLLAEALACAPEELVGAAAMDGANGANGADGAGSDGARRGQPAFRWVARLAALAAGLLMAVAAVGWYAVDRSTWEITDGNVIARDAVLGRVAWTIDADPRVRHVVPTPAGDQLVIGFYGNTDDGAQAWLVDRRTGERQVTFAVDETPVRRAFGPGILAEGQNFGCSSVRFLEFDGDGERELLFNFQHGKYYPAVLTVFELDGARRAQYANRGHVPFLHVEDLDDDGRDEVLAFGTNNDPAYQGASVIYLEQGAWSGAAVDPPGGPGRGPVGGIEDGARYRLVLPSFGEPVMGRMGCVRLTAHSPTVHRQVDGTLRINFTAGHLPAGGAAVVCDERLRPLLVNPTDSIRATVATWPTRGQGPERFPEQPWLEDWLDGARWSQRDSDVLVFGPVRDGAGMGAGVGPPP